jgi:hypothetical protein
MSTSRHLEELLELAYADVRAIEPTEAQIAAVLRDAAPSHPRRTSRRRIAAIAVASLLVATGTVFAVPQTRDAILGAFGDIGRFVSGGDAPGSPVPSGERPGQFNWLEGGSAASGSVIAQQGGARLVAFRHATTGYACFSYGVSVEECRPESDWIAQFSQSAVLLRGPLPQPDATGRLPLFGFVADAVTRIELRYASGPDDRLAGVSHGFIIMGDPTRSPQTLTAFDAAGEVVSRQDVTGRQWSFGP